MRLPAIIALALALTIIFPALAADTDDRVNQIFAAYDKADSPGCALGVIRNGAFVYRKGYGAASLELRVPLSAQSVFYMGSVSKQFTAASIVLAAEQGFLSLDDNVHKYITELPDYGQPITLRHMLHHTSGLRDVLGLLSLSGRSALDLHSKDEMIDLVARQKALNFSPGSGVPLQQHELLPAWDDREAGERKITCRIRSCEHLPAAGHDQDALLRRSHISCAGPGPRVRTREKWRFSCELVDKL